MEHEAFPKIPRLMKDMIITEKIDGTNAQIFIDDLGQTIKAGSRNRWVTSAADNSGFGRWVETYQDELKAILGPGRHFGEWWGQGIQRRYDMDMKVFSLFNTSQWEGMDLIGGQLRAVPVLGTYTFDTNKIQIVLSELRHTGSHAAPGFMDPEGIMFYHTAANSIFKYPFEAAPKGKV